MKRKTKEYTGDNADRLSAFKTAAALQDCTPQQALAEGVSFSLDTWNEKITDSLNYLFLLKAIVKEEYDH